MLKLIPLLALLVLSACASAPPKQQSDACEIFSQNRSWYKATRKTARKYGVSQGLQLAFIRQESGFRHNAKPARGKFLFVFPGKRPSSAKGYAQALDQTWDKYRRETGRRGASRKNFKDATDFIGWYARESRQRAGISLNDPYNQYLAYHEGQSGFSRGSYNQKPQVKRIARSVAQTAATYDAQLAQCRRKFNRGVPFVPGI